MADFERRQFEIGLEFLRWSFAERNNFSEGFSEPKEDAQGRRPSNSSAGGGSPTSFLTWITCSATCIRKWSKEYYESLQGFNDEDIKDEWIFWNWCWAAEVTIKKVAICWNAIHMIQKQGNTSSAMHAYIKGQPNLTSQLFADWVKCEWCHKIH